MMRVPHPFEPLLPGRSAVTLRDVAVATGKDNVGAEPGAAMRTPDVHHCTPRRLRQSTVALGASIVLVMAAVWGTAEAPSAAAEVLACDAISTDPACAPTEEVGADQPSSGGALDSESRPADIDVETDDPSGQPEPTPTSTPMPTPVDGAPSSDAVGPVVDDPTGEEPVGPEPDPADATGSAPRVRTSVTGARLSADTSESTTLAAAPLPLAASGCSYATAGPQAPNICWLDFAGFNATLARSAAGQDYTLALPGGYTARFNIFTSGANAAGLNAVAQGANSGVWATTYPGVAGRPILQRNTTGTTSVQLRNFVVTDSQGVAVPNFGMVAGDGESTGFGELLTFTTTGTPWTLVMRTQYGCGNTITGLGTTTVSCRGVNPQVPGGYGTAVFATNNPTNYTVSLYNSQLGTEAAVFGFQTATLTLNKTVNGRVAAGDSFDTTITSAQGTVLGSSSTGSAPSSTTGPVTLLPGSQAFTLRETASAGSTPLDEYVQSWTCVNGNTSSTTTLPSGTGTVKSIVLGIGDDVVCTITNTAGSPELTLDKVLSGNADEDASGTVTVGDTLSYTLTATNIGDVEIDGVVVSDPLTEASRTCATVAVAATCVLSTTHVVTQAEADAGQVANTGSAISSQTPDAVTDTLTVAVTQNPALSLVKTLTGNADQDGSGTVTVGDTLSYTLTSTNTGDITLTDVVVSDPLTGGSETCATLPISEDCELKTQYVVTQPAVDAGEVSNTGSAVAEQVPVPVTDAVTVDIPQAPELSLTKSAAPSDPASFVAGTEITYSFVVTNTGNVTIGDPLVTEGAFTGSGTPPVASCPSTAALAPGGQMICTATYTVQQADVDGGGINNTATASGTDPNGDTVISPPDDAPVPVDPAPGLTIDKSSSGGPFTTAGEVVTYAFLVRNSGNVTVSGVAVDDDAASFTGSGALSPVSCDTTTLLPGETVTCTASYSLTQDDVDQGSLANTATAAGTALGASVASPPDSDSFTIASAPSLTIVKSATPDAATEAGEQINYSFVVTNTGNVTLTDVGVDDIQFTGSGPVPSASCPPSEVDELAPGDDVTCTATYTLTQADIDAGSVENSASAVGTPPAGAAVASEPSVSTVTLAHAPALALTKSVSPATASRAGDEVIFSFLVTNTGNVTLTDIAIDEESFTGPVPLQEPSCPSSDLPPGADVTCTVTYTLTQEDVDSGGVVNTAIAVAASPGGAAVESSPSSAVVTVAAVPSLTIVKTASPATVTAAGQTVTYSFVVTNTGNVTLHDVEVAEGSFSGAGALSALECPDTPLAPTAHLTCTATYSPTQADVDAGAPLVNTADASGVDPNDTVVSSPQSSTAVVGVAGTATLELEIAVDSPVVSGPGQTVNYTFRVTNTGTVTLRDVVITNVAFTGSGGAPTIVCPPGEVSPGESVVCTAVYITTEADATAGRIDLTATATATTPSGAAVEAPRDEVEVTLPLDPEPPVTPPPPSPPGGSPGLPPTGVDVAGPTVVGLLLLAIGTALVIRRRKSLP